MILYFVKCFDILSRYIPYPVTSSDPQTPVTFPVTSSDPRARPKALLIVSTPGTPDNVFFIYIYL